MSDQGDNSDEPGGFNLTVVLQEEYTAQTLHSYSECDASTNTKGTFQGQMVM